MLVLRGVFVLVGAGLLERYDWMVYVFGVFLIYTSQQDGPTRHQVYPERNPNLRWRRSFCRDGGLRGQEFSHGREPGAKGEEVDGAPDTAGPDRRREVQAGAYGGVNEDWLREPVVRVVQISTSGPDLWNCNGPPSARTAIISCIVDEWGCFEGSWTVLGLWG